MKRFRFRLESVRALREVAESRAREKFGRAQQQVAVAYESLRLVTKQRVDLVLALSKARSGSFRPADQVSGIASLRQIELLEAEAIKALNEASAERDRVREEWLAARRALQIMQRLEERSRQAHRDAAEKAEQTLLDELASISASRVSPLV